MNIANGQYACENCEKTIYDRIVWIDDQPVCEECAEELEAHYLNNEPDGSETEDNV